MADPDITVEVLAGNAAAPLIPDLARLRMTVFREFPYLYDGSLDYEHKYLAKYAGLPDSTIVVVRADGRVVGASTALPLLKDDAEMIEPFRCAGLDPADFYYFGESVLLPEMRGRGLGVAFFQHREARARALGFPMTAFCAVARPADHPRRPKDYAPLDGFWTRRGYTKRPDLVCEFSWRDIDEKSKSSKSMIFWVKRLAP
ncbi:MAG: GNAT family N-acetyltransferase [Rhodospirillales bacterium]|nr:GNAT family N-acetyltransferase [Rhodospirillales bacterium]